jgi:hypothetical protein
VLPGTCVRSAWQSLAQHPARCSQYASEAQQTAHRACSARVAAVSSASGGNGARSLGSGAGSWPGGKASGQLSRAACEGSAMGGKLTCSHTGASSSESGATARHVQAGEGRRGRGVRVSLNPYPPPVPAGGGRRGRRMANGRRVGPAQRWRRSWPPTTHCPQHTT